MPLWQVGDMDPDLIFAWPRIIDINNIDNQLDATLDAPTMLPAAGRRHRGCITSIPQAVTHSLVLLKMGKIIARNIIFVVPCIMLNSEINPTRCNNCVYSSQCLYSTCFGWQFHPSSSSWWWVEWCWVELSPETCRVKPLRRINSIVASCWIYFTTMPETCWGDWNY